MNYRALGRTGLSVSEIGFGAWGIGGRTVGTTSYGDTDDRTSLAALAAALDAGITFFDTSAAYGNGHSEVLIGQALKGRRSKAVVATKAGYESWDRPPDFSAAAITASAEASLRRLDSDYIDLLQLHNAPTAALQAEVVQANFNMMDVRVLGDGLLEEVARRQAGFIGRTPLCFGFLAGTITRDTVFPAGDHRNGWSRAQLDNWIEGAAELLGAVSARPGAEGAE